MIKGVPYDAEIAFLESTGTQWVDIGVKAGSAPGIDVTFSLSDLANQVVFGARTNVFQNRFALFAISDGWRFDAYGQLSLNIATDTSSVFRFTYGNNTATMQNITAGTSASVTISPSNPGQYNLALFAINTAGTISFNMNGRIYACKIYDNGVLVRDYIPVRVGTVGYLYDRVTRKLYGNAGTGAFTLGPDVATPVMSLHRMAQAQVGTLIEWTDGYRYLSDGTTGESAGKSVMNTYIPIVGGHVYTVLCGAGGTANRYGHVYRQDKARIESVNESKANETFTLTAHANAAWLRYTCNTDAKNNTYVHDDTAGVYVVQNGRVLS